jgi:hypothetical protein
MKLAQFLVLLFSAVTAAAADSTTTVARLADLLHARIAAQPRAESSRIDNYPLFRLTETKGDLQRGASGA